MIRIDEGYSVFMSRANETRPMLEPTFRESRECAADGIFLHVKSVDQSIRTHEVCKHKRIVTVSDSGVNHDIALFDDGSQQEVTQFYWSGKCQVLSDEMFVLLTNLWK